MGEGDAEGVALGAGLGVLLVCGVSSEVGGFGAGVALATTWIAGNVPF